jgi:hypothetical protein
MRGRRPFFEPPKLWWLEIDEQGDTIRRAGRLTQAAATGSEIDMTAERFPSVVAGPDGKLSLVYLRQRPGTSRIELRWAPLEVDAKTGVPSASASKKLDSPHAEQVRLAPPVVSADGRSIFAANGAAKLVRFELPEAS